MYTQILHIPFSNNRFEIFPQNHKTTIALIFVMEMWKFDRKYVNEFCIFIQIEISSFEENNLKLPTYEREIYTQ